MWKSEIYVRLFGLGGQYTSKMFCAIIKFYAHLRNYRCISEISIPTFHVISNIEYKFRHKHITICVCNNYIFEYARYQIYKSGFIFYCPVLHKISYVQLRHSKCRHDYHHVVCPPLTGKMTYMKNFSLLHLGYLQTKNSFQRFNRHKPSVQHNGSQECIFIHISILQKFLVRIYILEILGTWYK